MKLNDTLKTSINVELLFLVRMIGGCVPLVLGV